MEIDVSKYKWRKKKDGGWVGTIHFDEEDPTATIEVSLDEITDNKGESNDDNDR